MQDAESCEHTECGLEIRNGGNETDGGGTRENAEIAHRADGGDRHADGHNVLSPHEREEYGHDVRTANADRKETYIEERVHRCKHDEQYADEGEECSTDRNGTLTDALNDPVAEENPIPASARSIPRTLVR